MRSSWVLLVVLGTGALAACGFESAAKSADDQTGSGGGSGDDDGSGSGAGSAPACKTFSDQLDTCQLTFGAAITLSGPLTFDTALGKLVDNSGTQVAVPHMTIATKGAMVEAIYAHDITLAANTTLRATGDKPIALIALGTITLADNAVIDVSAGGAGARATCKDAGQADAGAGERDSGGGGGGGGGGYGADGGDGGDGNSDHFGIGSRNSHGGPKGTQIAAMPAGPLGGCAGAAGGKGDDTGGAGGKGGGAVFLSAGDQIAVGTATAPATLNAGGGGGGGGGSGGQDGDDGGGGGGSGGMIWLEARHVVGPMAIFAANGGGGGEGSGGGEGGAVGAPGTLSTLQSTGGAGSADTGADGAAGGSSISPAGGKQLTVKSGGGGGGGGGVGIISLVSSDAAGLGTVSPIAVTQAH